LISSSVQTRGFAGSVAIARSGESNPKELQGRFGRYEGGCCLIPWRAQSYRTDPGEVRCWEMSRHRC